MIILTGETTGRLLQYDPATNSTIVLASGLSFPNGVALSVDGAHVVVAETTRCRLLHHWLRGSGTGTTEPFANLPGYPDNVRRAPDSGGYHYWVALNRDKSWLVNGTTPRSVAAVRVHGETGAVTEALRGLGNATVSEVVEQPSGALWLGSVDTPYVGLLKVGDL
jgi:hypothetical protein